MERDLNNVPLSEQVPTTQVPKPREQEVNHDPHQEPGFLVRNSYGV